LQTWLSEFLPFSAIYVVVQRKSSVAPRILR